MKHAHTHIIIFALSIFIFCGYIAKSQTTSNSPAQTHQRKDGTMEHLEWMKQQDPTLEAKMQAEEKKFNDYIATHQQELENNKAVYILPVVVHVVYNGTSGYVAPVRVTEQIEQTNSDWAGTNGRSMESFSPSLRADCEITLCLATVDPSGNPTTGIDYKTTTVSSFGTNNAVKYSTSGGANAWDWTKYLNIWVCNLPGLCGYAQFPTSGINATYGVVINYQYFGLTGAVAPYDLGGTVSHEFGHCFNLYHIWGDEDACSGSDYCTDVPNQATATYGDNSGVLTDACSPTSPGIMYMNFMDYSDDIDYANMTPNQKTRMQSAVSTYLTSVANNAATACAPPPAPVADFSANVTTSCTGVIQFTDASTNTPTSWAWTFGDAGTSTSQNPSHTYTASGTYTVSHTATNANGSDVETKTGYITINLPTAPSTTGDTICGTGTATLGASGSGTLNWYDAATGGTLLGTGTSYTTPTLTTTTTYYVQSDITQASQYCPPADNTIGTGGYYTGSTFRYQIFDVYTDIRLVSVVIYASGAGNRTIRLQNSSGTDLNTITANLSNGTNTLTLNWDIPAGTNYRLGADATTINNLYRNTAGASYPYTLSGLISITGNNYSTTTYYYFYNLEVQEAPCSSSRTPVTAVVNTALPASVSIAANPGSTICTGTSVTFTATATNGGTTPTYQWKKNGSNISGATNSTYTSTALANGDVITCVMTSNLNCVTGSPATSNSITMTVNAGGVASVSIAASPGSTICSGTSVTYTATPTNGGTPTYQWKKNGTNISGATNSTYTSSTLANNDVITCVMTSSLTCATGSPATSNSITMTVNVGGAASVSITATPGSTICSGTSVTFTATPTNGGTPTYQWKKNGTNISGATNSTYTSTTLANGDIINCVMTSSLTCATGSPATSNSITMTVNAGGAASVSIAASPTGSICAGTSVTFTATPTNGGTPTYQWKLNGTNITGGTNSTYTSSTLANSDVITCVMTSSLSCATGSPATSNSITMTVYPSVPVSISISANPSGGICTGTSVTFTATPMNGGATPTYQWKKNGTNISGATTTTYTSSALANGDVITCVLTSSVTCPSGNPATSNSITMSVSSAQPASVSIAASPSGTICTGTSVTFTATPINGGSAPTYQWKKNGTNISGATNSTYTSTALANGDVITCVMTSNLTCATGSPATSNSITMTVNSVVAASVSIAASPGSTICSGTSVTFTATPTNGGTPTYQWKKNGTNISGATNSTYTSTTLANGDVITCVMTSSLSCATGSPATSNSITMTVNSSLPASVSIAANPSGAICTGTSVIFTATPINGGTPTYQWQLNGSSISGATNSTYTSSTLANSDVITCIMISSITCTTGSPATSNAITMVVTTASTASVAIAASPSGTICSGTSVTFTATPSNGGTSPIYQWQNNGTNISGATNSTYSSLTLADGDVITCIMISNASCVSGSPATSNQISMTVNSALPASVSITASPSVIICSGDSVTFTATATNGGITPSYQWQLNGTNVGPNSSTVSTTLMSNGDIITCIMTSSLICATGNPATSNSLTMSVYTSLTVDVSIAAVPSGSICSGTNVIFTATPQNPGSSPTYQWQINGVDIGANYPTFMTTTLTNGDIVTCTLTSNSSCATNNPAYSNPITMVVSSALPAGVTITATTPISVCEGESVSFTATPANEGLSPNYQWQINSSNVGTNSPSFTYNSFTDANVVTCILTSSLTCASGNPATSNSIVVTVYPTPAAPVVTQIGDTLYSNYPSGNQWYYSNILGGFAISGATDEYYVPVITGDYYVIVMDSNGCVSDTSNVYVIIIGGINEAENQEITLYPNPSNGTFEINYQSVTGDNADMRLVNSIGQILLERNLTANSVSKIDASFLSQGMYFMKLTTNKTAYLYKVLITK